MARNHQLGLGSWPRRWAAGLERSWGFPKSWYPIIQSFMTIFSSFFFQPMVLGVFPHFGNSQPCEVHHFPMAKKGCDPTHPNWHWVLQHPVDLIHVGLRPAKAGRQWVQLDMGKPYWRLVMGILTSGALLKVCHIYDIYHTVYHYIKLYISHWIPMKMDWRKSSIEPWISK